MNRVKGIITISILVLLMGCVAQPVKKSSDYTVTFLSTDEIDQQQGKFVLVVNDDGKYRVYHVSDAFDEEFKKQYYGDVVSDGVLWVKGKTVSPYIFIPSGGHGQYDYEDKTFICQKSLLNTAPRGHKHPHPCWSPFVKYSNPLEMISSHHRKIMKIDYDEIVKAIEDSQLFNNLANPESAKNDPNAKTYLKVKYRNTAAITRVGDYVVGDNDDVLELAPGDYFITMHCMVNPRGHGPEKGKRAVEGVYTFEPGYYNYIQDGKGIAVVGTVCNPVIKNLHCRHQGTKCD